MSIVGGTFFYCPVFHSACHYFCSHGVQFFSFVNRLMKLPVNLFGKTLPHHLVTEYILAENFCRIDLLAAWSAHLYLLPRKNARRLSLFLCFLPLENTLVHRPANNCSNNLPEFPSTTSEKLDAARCACVFLLCRTKIHSA